jgi:hypothetical protein
VAHHFQAPDGRIKRPAFEENTQGSRMREGKVPTVEITHTQIAQTLAPLDDEPHLVGRRPNRGD